MSDYHHGNLKEALLARAAEVIEEGGIEALSLRGLARDLHVSHAAPGRHFKSRIDLLQTLAAGGYDQIIREVRKAASENDNDPLLRLNAMGKALVFFAIDNSALYRAILHPDVSRHADARLLSSLEEFAALIHGAVIEAQAAGWHKGEAPEVVVQHAMTSTLGIAFNMTDYLYKNVIGAPDRQVATKMIDLLLPVKSGASN